MSGYTLVDLEAIDERCREIAVDELGFDVPEVIYHPSGRRRSTSPPPTACRRGTQARAGAPGSTKRMGAINAGRTASMS